MEKELVAIMQKNFCGNRMPYAVRPSGGAFEVYNTETGRVFAKHADRPHAYGQLRILNRIRHHTEEDVIHMKVGGMAQMPRPAGTRSFVYQDGIPINVYTS